MVAKEVVAKAVDQILAEAILERRDFDFRVMRFLYALCDKRGPRKLHAAMDKVLLRLILKLHAAMAAIRYSDLY